ncbi:MAG: signal peptidase II [Treponema sp.]|nr:signal peptidase II [Treponema sp.]
MKPKFDRERCLPFLLTAFVVLLDQGTKWLIASRWPIGSRIWPAPEVFSPDNFLQIIHVRNLNLAFSLGRNLPEEAKQPLFVLLPIILLATLIWYCIGYGRFTGLQRWMAAGFLGGGIGNMLDRIFRPEGVVDFISVRFYGIFGFRRWPTFNVADAGVVICGLLLLFTVFLTVKKSKTFLPETGPQETPSKPTFNGVNT